MVGSCVFGGISLAEEPSSTLVSAHGILFGVQKCLVGWLVECRSLWVVVHHVHYSDLDRYSAAKSGSPQGGRAPGS